MSELERMIADLGADDRAAFAEWCSVAVDIADWNDPRMREVFAWLTLGARADGDPLSSVSDAGLASLGTIATDQRGRTEFWELNDELVTASPEPLWSSDVVDVWAEVAARASEEVARRRRARLEP